MDRLFCSAPATRQSHGPVIPDRVERKRMKTPRLAAFVGALALALPLGFVAFAQEGPKPGVSPGRYLALASGVLDTSSGAAYFVDPLSPEECVTLDLPGCRAFVRPVAK